MNDGYQMLTVSAEATQRATKTLSVVWPDSLGEPTPEHVLAELKRGGLEVEEVDSDEDEPTYEDCAVLNAERE
jgi:hypothetical protein